ncbi:MAG: hypothetical protein DI534_11730 [Leifsonia xyli]|nr:MAG: hypothetical protein DI534_11730 [Leifsonia xyli]
MRASRVASSLLAMLASAAVLSGCASEPPPAEATGSREVVTASRCLTEHSPWTLDLDEVFTAWSGAIPADRQVRGGEVTGTATLSFTAGTAPSWTFTANKVDYQLFFDDGTTESTSLARELQGRYTIRDAGGTLELSAVQVVAAATDASTVTEDGTLTAAVSIAAPSFPWDDAEGASISFTCTEHLLLVRTPEQSPATWSLYPG